MEQFNKVISFVLGLVVVVLFLAVATGKINLKGISSPFSKNTSTVKITPTSTPAPKKNSSTAQNSGSQGTSMSPSTSNVNYHQYSPGTLNTIPSTGPEFLIPLIASSLFGGLFLRGKGKK